MKTIGRHLLAVMSLMSSTAVMAAEVTRDPRLEGYESSPLLQGGSSVLDWFIIALLGAIGVGVMFINAKRTHLD